MANANASLIPIYQGQPGALVQVGPLGTPSSSTQFAPALVAFTPLAPVEYDYLSMGYTGSNLTTVKYYLGGASGALQATLTLGYDGSNNLISVTRS
jgi:hypothetical protein